MKHISLVALVMGLSLIMNGQTLSDFEQILVEPDTFLNGSDGSGGWEVGNIFLPNDYNADWESWSGWAISSMTDVTTAGFENQYSCIAGSGVNGTNAYAVAYLVGGGPTLIETRNAAMGGVVNGFYINNSTYAYLSMQDGDAFAKRFGGEEGTDPDYLYVTIKEYGSRDKGDSLNVFLADYRSDNASEDYILDEWTYVDLSGFNNVDTLSFEMHSSDVGAFGINTPTYFCVDNIETADSMNTSTQELVSEETRVPLFYPNPATTSISLFKPFIRVSLFNSTGQEVRYGDSGSELDVSGLESGIYLMKLIDEQGEMNSDWLRKI